MGQPNLQALLDRMSLHRVLEGVPELSEKTVGVSKFRQRPTQSRSLLANGINIGAFLAKSGARAGRASAFAHITVTTI